jgi:hypothetical protein
MINEQSPLLAIMPLESYLVTMRVSMHIPTPNESFLEASVPPVRRQILYGIAS